MVLNETLAEYGIGGVHVVSDWPYHGKVYLFGDSAGLFGGSVGSSNLTAIVDPHNLVELDFYVEQQEMLTQLEDFIDDTLRPASISIEEYDRILDDGDKRYSEKFDFYADFGDSPLSIFDGVLAVSDIELADIRGRLRLPEFTHRLKTADSSPRRTPKSNINAYHGKPRLRRSRTGDFLVPRPWYEFEIILGVNEMNDPSCPPSGDFQVVTDDGYSFSCRRQGDPPELGGKNIRSTGTLLILGKWVKGRLEEAGALRPGELVTDATLGAYGRDHIAFSRIDGEDNRWYLDFSIPQGR